MDENFDKEFRKIIDELGVLNQKAVEMKIYDTANAIHAAIGVAQNEYLKIKNLAGYKAERN